MFELRAIYWDCWANSNENVKKTLNTGCNLNQVKMTRSQMESKCGLSWGASKSIL